jgi:hypothetical protein
MNYKKFNSCWLFSMGMSCLNCCWYFRPLTIEETRRLIVEEVDRTLDVKIFSISLSANKTFLVNYLLDDSSNGTMEFIEGEQMEHIQDKFCELSSPNIHNLVAFFKCHFRRWLYWMHLWIEVQELVWLHLGMMLPKTSSWTKGVYFQDVDKWCREWS